MRIFVDDGRIFVLWMWSKRTLFWRFDEGSFLFRNFFVCVWVKKLWGTGCVEDIKKKTTTTTKNKTRERERRREKERETERELI